MCLSALSSVKNSLRISEITAIGDTSDVLLVSMVVSPREAPSGMDTTSTGRNGGVGGEVLAMDLMDLVDFDVEDLLVEIVMLEVDADSFDSVGIIVMCSDVVMKILLPALTA